MRRPRDKRRGVALLLVITWIALMTAVVGEFTYGTAVDAAQAANARDELKAHYLARSGVNLSRLLIKIQIRFVDPVMTQATQMVSQFMGKGASGAGGAGGSAAGMGLGFSLRVTDYAGPLMGFFSGTKDEVSALGGLVGIDTSGIKGLGLKNGRFDAEITPEDGKIDINCGSFIRGQNPEKTVFRLLNGLMYSRRFDRLFSEADSSGQFASRLDVARAIIDWADADDQMFTPDGPSSGSEDYRYDARADRYRAHDNAYDTVEEVKMVRGVSEGFMEAFQPYLTVYANNNECKVNLGAITNKTGGDCTPLLMGVIRAAAVPNPAQPPTSPAVLDDTRLYPIASVLCDRASTAGFDNLGTITSMLQNPQNAVLPDDPRYKMLQGLGGISLSQGDLNAVAVVGPPRVYKIVAMGESGKVKKKITAIVDTKRTLDNPLTLNPQAEQAAGALQYWREE